MTILLVDDDPDSQLLIRLLLEGDGAPEVVSATSGAQACELVASKAHAIELVLMNMQMPGVDGIETVRRLKQIDAAREIPMIMVTTQYEPDVLNRAYAAGAMDYVRKPLERSEFLARVRSALTLKRETDERKAREHELMTAKLQLEASLATLKAGLEAAARLQRSLLPDPRVTPPGVAWASRFLPCEAIGGDLFNVTVAVPGTVSFYMLDVAGHGMPAALFCVGLHRLLSAGSAGYLLDSQGRLRPPAELAALLNQDFQIGGDTLNYFTMIYATLDLADGSLDYVQAGHPGMVLVPPDTPVRVAAGGNLAVGLMPQVSYRQEKIQLAEGSRIVIYSDGVIDAARAGDGEPFGAERLLKEIEAARGASLDDMLDAILHGVTQWQNGAAQGDDIALFAIEVTQLPLLTKSRSADVAPPVA